MAPVIMELQGIELAQEGELAGVVVTGAVRCGMFVSYLTYRGAFVFAARY